MSLLFQHVEGLYAAGNFAEIRSQLALAAQASGKPFPACIFRELAYAESKVYRTIRDENFFPIRFLWLFELHEQRMFNLRPLERSAYHPEGLYDRWLRCLTDDSFRKEAEESGVLFDMNNKAISLRLGWVLIGDSFIEDLIEVEQYYGADLLVPDETTGEMRPLFADYKSSRK